ncbi:Replication initiation protein [compost metagenome]
MTPQKQLIVVKSNKLVEASYRLDLIEQRIILYAIMEARETQKGLTDDFVTIEAKRFSSMFKMEGGAVYNQLKTAMDTLFNRHIVVHDIHPESGYERVSKVRWISTASYIDGAGAVQLRFSTDMLPYITRLETEFTSYRLEKIGRMSSVHAVRLYELLVQYLSIGKREVEIAWLKETFGMTDEYPRIDSLKKRVIDVAVAQINEFSDIRVSYTQRKTGRTVTHLLFAITPELKPAQTKRKIRKLTDAEVAKRARPGESWEAAHTRLNQISLALAE